MTFVFVIGFIVTALLSYGFLISKKTYPIVHFFNRVFGFIVFFFSAIKITREWRFKRDKKQTYMYCANHTSYIDIPTFFLTVPGYFNIIGKSELRKLPFFGYMFNKLYISVNRKSVKGRYESFQKVVESIESGRDMCFFPEGTIPKAEKTPYPIPFRDGAFKAAIQKQIPIVPITIPYNWIILGDNGSKTLAKWHSCKVIFHKPISTIGKTEKDINEVKKQAFDVIDQEIRKIFPNGSK